MNCDDIPNPSDGDNSDDDEVNIPVVVVVESDESEDSEESSESEDSSESDESEQDFPMHQLEDENFSESESSSTSDDDSDDDGPVQRALVPVQHENDARREANIDFPIGMFMLERPMDVPVPGARQNGYLRIPSGILAQQRSRLNFLRNLDGPFRLPAPYGFLTRRGSLDFAQDFLFRLQYEFRNDISQFHHFIDLIEAFQRQEIELEDLLRNISQLIIGNRALLAMFRLPERFYHPRAIGEMAPAERAFELIRQHLPHRPAERPPE